MLGSRSAMFIILYSPSLKIVSLYFLANTNSMNAHLESVKIFIRAFHKIEYDVHRAPKNFSSLAITQTCPCNEDPFTPHFYIVKLGFTGVYIFFLFLLQNIDCGYPLEPPH